jgi:hypothetical protein
LDVLVSRDDTLEMGIVLFLAAQSQLRAFVELVGIALPRYVHHHVLVNVLVLHRMPFFRLDVVHARVDLRVVVLALSVYICIRRLAVLKHADAADQIRTCSHYLHHIRIRMSAEFGTLPGHILVLGRLGVADHVDLGLTESLALPH